MDRQETRPAGFRPTGRKPDRARVILGEITRLKNDIEAIENDMNDSIERIKATAAAFAEPRKRRLAGLIDTLAAFTGENDGIPQPPPRENEPEADLADDQRHHRADPPRFPQSRPPEQLEMIYLCRQEKINPFKSSGYKIRSEQASTNVTKGDIQ